MLDEDDIEFWLKSVSRPRTYALIGAVSYWIAASSVLMAAVSGLIFIGGAAGAAAGFLYGSGAGYRTYKRAKVLAIVSGIFFLMSIFFFILLFWPIAGLASPIALLMACSVLCSMLMRVAPDRVQLGGASGRSLG